MIFEPVQAELQKVRRRIGEVIVNNEPFVLDLLNQVMDRPGKLIRPALVLLTGKACGDLHENHIELAAIVELIHAATLLHDDVIDRASVRRNRPSANILWGNTAAVLLGDFLLSRAFALGVQINRPEMSERLVRTAEKICEGELLQNLLSGNWELTEQQYDRIIDGKTASLFACCAWLGGLAAGAETSVLDSVNAYGRLLGQAFQIRDDLLDLLGSESACGKTLGTDLAECKPTLPLIVWLQTLSAEQKAAEVNCLSQDAEAGRILQAIRQSGAVESVQRHIQRLCEQAGHAIGDLPNGPAKAALLQLAGSIASPL